MTYDFKEGALDYLRDEFSAENPNQFGSREYADWEAGRDFAEKFKWLLSEVKP